MNEAKFYLKLYCNVGWDESEEVGELEVDNFHYVLEIVSCIKSIKKDKELYEYIKETVEVPSGEEVFSVWDVIGIEARLKTESGVTVEIELNDNSGIHSSCRVDEEKYQSDNRKKLKEVRGLAVQILRV